MNTDSVGGSRINTPLHPKAKGGGDLDWFDFETRMRKLISELLEPTVLRTQDDKNQIVLLRKMNETLKKRMDDGEFMQAKAFKRMDKLEEVWARIRELVSLLQCRITNGWKTMRKCWSKWQIIGRI